MKLYVYLNRGSRRITLRLVAESEEEEAKLFENRGDSSQLQISGLAEQPLYFAALVNAVIEITREEFP